MVQRHRGVEDSHVVLCAGVQVDLVVAGPRAADHEEIHRAVGECPMLHLGTEHHQSFDIPDMVGRDLERIEPRPVRGIARPRGQVSQEVPSDVGAAFQPGQADVAVCDGARIVQEVAGQREAEDSHRETIQSSIEWCSAFTPGTCRAICNASSSDSPF
jgi:hypothetical protein